MRIVLADDHEVVRKGVKALLEGHSQWTVCGEAGNGQEAVDLVVQLQPELIVLDLSMPIMNGLRAAAKIRQLFPATKIVILSMHDSPRIRPEALDAGADAFVTKSAAGAELIQTIDALFSGISHP
ncbi:MAG: response regulator transcription factor [Candidatus Acidiferrales bacterium]